MPCKTPDCAKEEKGDTESAATDAVNAAGVSNRQNPDMPSSRSNSIEYIIKKSTGGIGMFQFWGDGSQESMDLVNAIRVRSTENFNWTFIFILAVVFYVYWTEIHKKNTEITFTNLKHFFFFF